LHARYVRAIITGITAAIPVSLCIWMAATLLDRAYAPAIAEHRDTLCVGCDILFIVLLALIALFIAAGAATAAFCGRRVSDAGEAGVAGGIAGVIACVISGVIFVVPWFQDLMSHDASLYSLGPAHTALSIVSMIIETGIYGAIYLFFGFCIAMFGGYLYYRRRRKKGLKI
jgi:hypothetical protein